MQPSRIKVSQLDRGLLTQSSMTLLCAQEQPMTGCCQRVTVSKGFRQGKSRPAGEATSRMRGRSGGLPAAQIWLPGPAVPRGSPPGSALHCR